MNLEELFELHHADLFRFISRMTGDPELAMDVVQETFVSVATRPIPDEVSSKAWIFRMALNLARSDLRKRRRRLRLLRANHGALVTASPDPSPESATERAETRARVRRALAGLSEKERTILVMREEGFTHREIARAVGTTTGSVGTMFARALGKLERLLDREGGEEP